MLRVRLSYQRQASIWAALLLFCFTSLFTVPAFSQAGLTLIAGDTSGPGAVDATGATARFRIPAAIAVDAGENVYVADTGNHTIRKVTSGGGVSTLAGSAGMIGSVDGPQNTSRFNTPIGIAVDTAGNVYVADTGNHIIRKVSPSGVTITVAGTAQVAGSTDGTGAAARFNAPTGIAVDAANNLYVADAFNHTIRKVSPAGAVTTLAGMPHISGSDNGTGQAAQFNTPVGIAVDKAGNLYVADAGNNIVRKIDGTGVVTTVAGMTGIPAANDGIGAAAGFNTPFGIASDNAGNVLVADTGNFTVRRIGADGIVTTVAGSAGNFGNEDGGASARFSAPYGIAVSPSGVAYVADTGSHNIRSISLAGEVTTYAGPLPGKGSVDGAGAVARFNIPFGIARDVSGSLYVSDTGSHTIRKIATSGVVTTLAGATNSPGTADGSGNASQFNFPYGIAVDTVGNLYVADTGNHAIRKITATGVVITLAGVSGQAGNADGAGPDARFNTPVGIAVDSAGTVYVADTGNHTIRKITPAGVVSTLAGVAGSFSSGADGIGPAARFNTPLGITSDLAGNLYVADSGNHTIRKVNATGEVSTIAGSVETAGIADGNGRQAQFNTPVGIVVDTVGTVYIADTVNQTIRKLTPAGDVTTIAGTPNVRGIALGALPGNLDFPVGLTLIGPTSLAVTSGNSVIKLTLQ